MAAPPSARWATQDDTMDSESQIFEPDVVLAPDFYAPRTGLPDPERSLMIAVLEEASRCLLNYCTSIDRKQRQLYEEARDWFASEDYEHLYSYENVCHVLGIDPAYLRRRIFAVRDRRAASTASSRRPEPAVATDTNRKVGMTASHGASR